MHVACIHLNAALKHHPLPHYHCHSTLNVTRCLNHSILHHFHLVEQLLHFSCEMEQKYVVSQGRNYATNKKVEHCLFYSSFLYLFLLEEKEKQRKVEFIKENDSYLPIVVFIAQREN